VAFTGEIYFRILGLGLDLGSLALALYVSGLGLDTSGLVNIPDLRYTCGVVIIEHHKRPVRSCMLGKKMTSYSMNFATIYAYSVKYYGLISSRC